MEPITDCLEWTDETISGLQARPSESILFNAILRILMQHS